MKPKRPHSEDVPDGVSAIGGAPARPMAGEGRRTHGASGRDGDGVRVIARPRPAQRVPWLLLLVAVVAVGVGWRWLERSAPAVAGDPRDGAVTPSTSADGRPAGTRLQGSSGRAEAAHARVDGEDPTPDLSDYVLPGEAPTMGQVIHALQARGMRSGLGAFPPPGTRPPLQGLAVPDDFPLPAGYVRHRQATDDGQPIPPILMFAPELDSVVVNGRRVPVPADRVVPPGLAPPGLPLRQVRIPPPLGDEGRP